MSPDEFHVIDLSELFNHRNDGSDQDKNLFFWKLLITSSLHKKSVSFKIVGNQLIIKKSDCCHFVSMIQQIDHFSTSAEEYEMKKEKMKKDVHRRLDRTFDDPKYNNVERSKLEECKEAAVLQINTQLNDYFTVMDSNLVQWNQIRQQVNSLYDALLSIPTQPIESILHFSCSMREKDIYGRNMSWSFDFKYFKHIFDADFYQHCNLEQRQHLMHNMFFNKHFLLDAMKALRNYRIPLQHRVVYHDQGENWCYCLVFDNVDFAVAVQDFLNNHFVCDDPSMHLNKLRKHLLVCSNKVQLQCESANDLENWHDFLKIYQLNALLKENLGESFANFKFEISKKNGKKHIVIKTIYEAKEIIIHDALFHDDIMQVCHVIRAKIKDNIELFLAQNKDYGQIPNLQVMSKVPEKDRYTFLYVMLSILITFSGIGLPVGLYMIVAFATGRNVNNDFTKSMKSDDLQVRDLQQLQSAEEGLVATAA